MLRVPDVAPLRCLWGCLPVLHALCVVCTGEGVAHGPHGWPHGLHVNGGQRCRPARHRGMDTRENKGCKEAAGVHSCAGRRGTGLFTCLWSCLLSALGVLRVLRGLHVRFCDCLRICLPMSYLFCALCMFCRQHGRSMGIRSSMGIRMSRDTSMSRGTSTSR